MKKTKIEDIDRSVYDIIDDVKIRTKAPKGLNEDIIKKISKEKGEPSWMLDIRLRAFKEFEKAKNPDWGPDLTEVDLNKISTYIAPDAKKEASWEDVPEEIKNTFDRLGIVDAEKKYLAGVSAQFDSEEIYHNVKDYLVKKGVIYMDMSTALKEHEELVKKYFSKLIDEKLHKYAALHLAVWSGGSFVYVPKGVELDIPIQSYYRLNAPGAGQFEHTLIVVEDNASLHFIEGCSAPKYNTLNIHAGSVEIFVGKNAKMKFSTIENWSKNMYNLNTKKALVKEGGNIDWVSGSFGSKVSMLYPTTILEEKYASMTYTGLTFASSIQEIDNGSGVIHLAPFTNSNVNTKSISKGSGKSVTRNHVYISKEAINSVSNSDCSNLMLDKESISYTIPVINVKNNESEVIHEATTGKISPSKIFYLMSRGLTEEEAKEQIIKGFSEPISKLLPIEYAVEMNNLIGIELEGTNG